MTSPFKIDFDCDLIEICEQYDNVYGICTKGAASDSCRCTPGNKILIKLLVQINEKLDLINSTSKR